MAEIIQKDGTWTFDGDVVRIVPGSGGKTHPVRQSLGELGVPLEALAGVAFEPGRRSGRLRLKLRDGSDPLLLAADGRLPDNGDPYRLTVENDRTGVAEYFVDELRNALLLDQVPDGPADRFLLPGPAVPVSGGGGDGTASFDGDAIRLTWNWKAEESKNASGATSFPLGDVTAVQWLPAMGLENGHLRFVMRGRNASGPAKYDPYALDLWGLSRKEHTAVLVAAAVIARLPHPSSPHALRGSGDPRQEAAPAGGPPAVAAAPSSDDHDVLLRRLRELGELHRSGILTDEEFTTAKQAVLKRM
ncbi:DUF4429 domain-containing protein [Streptomyces sp. FIT100]|uniref:DUF4429 domain-containing protein n=1 Tax=Streptomyces sp. FIT100 TaxID=2837956 RepID=UPI0021C89C2A|nr:DUF4429 domain-containing protein [Streptomyces sp. FIT100]UUN27026.1 DUF4429 domain-containing protein [Streptomyces sp. FIT100]